MVQFAAKYGVSFSLVLWLYWRWQAAVQARTHVPLFKRAKPRLYKCIFHGYITQAVSHNGPSLIHFSPFGQSVELRSLQYFLDVQSQFSIIKIVEIVRKKLSIVKKQKKYAFDKYSPVLPRPKILNIISRSSSNKSSTGDGTPSLPWAKTLPIYEKIIAVSWYETMPGNWYLLGYQNISHEWKYLSILLFLLLLFYRYKCESLWQVAEYLYGLSDGIFPFLTLLMIKHAWEVHGRNSPRKQRNY